MIEFILKSTICLTMLYGFYYFFLRNIKSFDFNRFFLLFSLLFAMFIPLINIHVSSIVPVNQSIYGFTIATKSFVKGVETVDETIHFLTLQNVLVILYILVSFFLLIRFAVNIYKIIRIIRRNAIIKNSIAQIVLVDKETLPYSFFRYIFLNRSDYKNGKIEKELIIHEQVHCKQYHSVDILLIEIVKIFLWFNPLAWLFSKAIQLNHEFLADNQVLLDHDLNSYQNKLITLVFRNNFTYMASRFNYSLTKKRLMMMKKNSDLSKVIYRKVAVIPIFLILAITLTFSQETEQKGNPMKIENEWWMSEWWYPILVKHSINPTAFNNFKNIFEMGENNAINNGVCTLTNAVMIIRDSVDNYLIIESPLIIHNYNNETIKANSGTLKKFKKDSNPNEPYEVYQIERMELHALKN